MSPDVRSFSAILTIGIFESEARAEDEKLRSGAEIKKTSLLQRALDDRACRKGYQLRMEKLTSGRRLELIGSAKALQKPNKTNEEEDDEQKKIQQRLPVLFGIRRRKRDLS